MPVWDLERHFARTAGVLALAHLAVYGALNLVASALVARGGGDAVPTALVIAYGLLGTPLMHVLEFGLPGLSAVLGDRLAIVLTAILNAALWGTALALLFRRMRRRQHAGDSSPAI